jgi:hypothetical protein
MTILSQHTVTETRDLIRATEFRVNKLAAQLERVTAARGSVPASSEQLALTRDFASFVRRWTDVRDKQLALMGLSIATNPNVHPAILPAEPNFQAIVNVSTREEPRLIDLQGRITAEGNLAGVPPVDLSQIPPQNSPDADFLALKKLDEAIKAAEERAKGAATSKTGLLVIGGVVAALGVAGYLYTAPIRAMARR